MSEEATKPCFKCGEIKPLSLFYKHPRMADGHVNKCKECNKQDVKRNRKDNEDYYKEFDRVRSKKIGTVRHKTRLNYARRKDVQARRKKYSQDETVKLKKKELLEKRRLEFPEKYKANHSISNGIRDGKVTRPCHCEYCGKECKPHAHHSSYSEDMWLLVTWLCSSCHGEVHRIYD